MAIREVGPGKTYLNLLDAWNAANNNDTIVVFAGTYSGVSNSNLTLSVKTGITIRNNTGDTPKFDGLGVDTAIFVLQTPITFSGLHLYNTSKYCFQYSAGSDGTSVSSCIFELGANGNYGAYIGSLNNNLTFTNCQFYQYNDGTGPSASTYGIHSSGANNWTISQCTFHDLSTHLRFSNAATSVTLDRVLCYSKEGVTPTTGTAIDMGISSGSVVIKNSILTDMNRGLTTGSSIDGVVSVYNCTIDNCNKGIQASAYMAALKNTIISNCTTGLSGDDGGDQPAPDYCNFYNNGTDIYWYTAATNSIDANPQYVNTTINDYSLTWGSTSINAGTSLVGTVDWDYLGVTRPQGIAYDMGAYEYPETGWSAGKVMGLAAGDIATVNSVLIANIAKISGV